MIAAGKLRYRVTIQAPADGSEDGYGHPDITYPESAWVSDYMSVEQTQGKEFFEGRAVLGKDTVRFRGRYRTGSTNRHRLVYNSVTYQIESVIDIDERHRELVYLATRVKDA